MRYVRRDRKPKFPASSLEQKPTPISSQGLSLPPSLDTPTPESILALRRQVQETKKLNRALRNTHAQNSALISQLSRLLSPPSNDNPSLSFLTSKPAAATLGLTFSPSKHSAKDAGPLSTQSQFFVTQLPALREALDALRPKLRSLPGKIGDVDWESRREERRKYIEDRVREVAGVRGREEATGPRMGIEEVRDLEALTGRIAEGQ